MEGMALSGIAPGRNGADGAQLARDESSISGGVVGGGVILRGRPRTCDSGERPPELRHRGRPAKRP